MSDLFKNESTRYLSILSLINASDEITLFLDNIETDLEKRELFHLFNFFRSLDKNFILRSYTSEKGAIKGNSGWIPINDSVDNDIQTIINNPRIIVEQARVEVLNSTDKPGVASRRARLLENTGFRVVRVGNASGEVDITTIYVDRAKRFEDTINELVNIFGEDNVRVVEADYQYRHVGDIIIVLAE
jgi:hypothetical protein